MKLQEFLKKINGKKVEIVNYLGDEALAAINQNGYALKYVKEQTTKICLAAVSKDGDALQFVKKQTEKICLAAVCQNDYALQYVDKNIFD